MALSPLNQRRWRNFTANRRALWSLWIFGVLFGLSLCAELIANDRPLLVQYRGGYYTKPRSAAISRPRRSIAMPRWGA
jgi:microcin C transport system permease protein